MEGERKPTALVADDDGLIRLMIRKRLSQFGFDIIEAKNGEEAVSLFRSSYADIVLLDVMMPGMNGFDVCRCLRCLPGCGDLPILMITGLDDVESINEAYEAGATDFAMKPINWLFLGQRVRYMWRASLLSKKNNALLNAIPDMVFQVRDNGMITDYKGPKDFKAADFLGKKLEDTLFFEHTAKPMYEQIEQTLRKGEMQVCEYEIPVGETRRSYESRIVASGKDEVCTIIRDITERKKAEEQILHLAYYDQVTGLHNRHYFRQLLGEIINRSKRYNRLAAIIFLDIDRFKLVNDTFGHDIGDLFLREVADRLVSSVRNSDLAAYAGTSESLDYLARLGGDEFTILLTEINDMQDAGKVARRLLKSLSVPFVILGNEIFGTASIGIGIYPYDGEDPDALIKNADAAMYHAKNQGGNNFQYYSKSMNAEAFARLSLENSLRKALDRGEFELYYQPQVSIKTGRIIGTESLIRWMHPEMGLVPPSHFINLAEETGLIIPIGEWVLNTACAQNQEWQNHGFGPLHVSVNISALQFRQQDVLGVATSALNRSGLDPSLLDLELTENSIMQNPERTAYVLRNLKEMGLKISIDDFGVAYSSLSYLKRFPLDTLKIDKSFIDEITSDAAISIAIIAMAHSLRLNVVAEGVETKEQLNLLREKECDAIQGYLFSRPVPADSLTSMLRDNKTL